MFSRLTDGNKQSLISDPTNLILQTVDNDRCQHGLSRSRLAREGQGVIMALQEASQVWAHPQAGQLLTLVSKVGGVLGEVVEDAVFGSEPGANRLDNGNYNIETDQSLHILEYV